MRSGLELIFDPQRQSLVTSIDFNLFKIPYRSGGRVIFRLANPLYPGLDMDEGEYDWYMQNQLDWWLRLIEYEEEHGGGGIGSLMPGQSRNKDEKKEKPKNKEEAEKGISIYPEKGKPYKPREKEGGEPSIYDLFESLFINNKSLHPLDYDHLLEAFTELFNRDNNGYINCLLNKNIKVQIISEKSSTQLAQEYNNESKTTSNECYNLLDRKREKPPDRLAGLSSYYPPTISIPSDVFFSPTDMQYKSKDGYKYLTLEVILAHEIAHLIYFYCIEELKNNIIEWCPEFHGKIPDKNNKKEWCKFLLDNFEMLINCLANNFLEDDEKFDIKFK